MSIPEPAGPRFGLQNLVWLLVVLGGAVVWLLCVTGSEEARAWQSLLANFLFFTPLAGGLVVWPAIVRACNGRWHSGLERSAAAAVSFAVPSILILVLLWSGSPRWSPWYRVTHHQGLWLHNSFVFGRDLAALVLFWLAAALYLSRRRHGQARGAGGCLILVYCLVFSLLGMDLVMGLDPHWYSTLAGGYFFISGLYIGISGWAFLASWQSAADADRRHDLGKLIVGFSMMTAYLMYAHLLPFWYENLPHEVRFVMPRLAEGGWRSVSYLLVALVYLGPMAMLLTERAKRSRLGLGAVTLIILAGMWLERLWLVVPTLAPTMRLGLLECGTAAAFAGLFALGLDQFERRTPAPFLTEEG